MIVVFSIHADDACFSVGEWLAQNQDVAEVVTLCGGAPARASEEDGLWQAALNAEGDRAYAHLGANHATISSIYDGKWGAQTEARQRSLLHQLTSYYAERRPDISAFLVPMGIHHPDHRLMAPPLLNFLLAKTTARVAIYEDLPYRVMYPEDTAVLRYAQIMRFGDHMESAANAGFLKRKLEACAMFESQWSPPEGDAPRCCSVPERLWWAR